MKVYITSDSSCDLSKELLEKYNIKILPFSVTMGDELYIDGVDITPEMIFAYVKENKKLPKTSAVNEEQYAEFFTKVLGNDANAYVVHIGLSSGLSCSYSNSVAASERFGGHVVSVDGKNLSTGTGLLVLYAAELAQQGLSAQEIKEKVEERVNAVQASFIIEETEYLYRGGRCSALSMLGANLLKIKPRIQVIDGVMKNTGKPRGKMIAVLKQYVDETLKEFNNPDTTRCFVTHSSIEPEIANEIVEYVKSKNIFNEVHLTTAGATITCHCGKGTLGLLYINDGGKA